jgi:hypothetical protein
MRPGLEHGDMITLFVGDNTEYLADQAKLHDPGAFLIDFSNWRKILKKHSPDDTFTAYVSLSDLPKIDKHISVLWELLKISDMIYYVSPTIWSDHNENFSWESQKTLTEYYLYQCQIFGKNVIGLNLEDYRHASEYLVLADKRKNEHPTLWISGCSISHGVGVTPKEKYGYLIGKSISRPTSYLTESGSSLEWQADQILRSDIQKNDIVIWGLTSEKRAPRAQNGHVLSYGEDTIEDIDYRSHETRYYKAITSVFQVMNYCEKIGCELILMPIICSEKLQMDLMYQKCYHQTPYFVKFLDLGDDDLHPGTRQHRVWADFCLEILKR